MTSISAALVSKATDLGFKFVDAGSRVEVHNGKGVLSFHADPSRALELAMLKHAKFKAPADTVIRVVSPPAVVVTPKGMEFALPPAPDYPPEVVGEAVATAILKVVKGSIIKPQYKQKYKKNGDYSCGDFLSEELRGYIAVQIKGRMMVSLERLKEVAMVNQVWKPSYEKLNPGQQRMTIGNCLRNKLANGIAVDIGGVPIKPERAPGMVEDDE